MKVRVVITLDVDAEQWKEEYPLLTQRVGSVRGAVRDYVSGAVDDTPAARSSAVRSITVAE